MSESDLPPELWARIFYFTSDRRADIASCRLVNKFFCATSSEYLITKVVVAKRPSSLQQLWDVLEHPYFRHHVTELIYDASCYNEHIVSSMGTYAYVCNKFSSRAHLHQGAKARASELDKLSLRVRRSKDLCSPSDSLEAESLGPLEFHLEASEYTQSWINQEAIISKNLHFDSLECSLRRLPNLRKITYTDFRHLARPDETYLALCQRLFGSIVEPNGVNLDFETITGELVSVLRIVRGTAAARIRSLSIGGHPYEFPEMDACWPTPGTTGVHLPWAQTALSCNFLGPIPDDNASDDNEAPFDDLSGVLTLDLEHLRLPVNIPLLDALDGGFYPNLHVPRSHVRSFLQCNTSTLARLELFAVEDKVDADEDRFQLIITTHEFFTALMRGLVFESLHRLDLHNWQFRDTEDLQEFFSHHSSTLRKVRLLECALCEDPVHIAKWVGEHMSLTGVDIDIANVSFLIDDDDDDDDDERNDEDDDDNHDDDSDSIKEAKVSHSPFVVEKTKFDNDGTPNKEGAQNRMMTGSFLKEDIARIKEAEGQKKAKLEGLWLAGRPNNFQRSIITSSTPSCHRLFKDSVPNVG